MSPALQFELELVEKQMIEFLERLSQKEDVESDDFRTVFELGVKCGTIACRNLDNDVKLRQELEETEEWFLQEIDEELDNE